MSAAVGNAIPVGRRSVRLALAIACLFTLLLSLGSARAAAEPVMDVTYFMPTQVAPGATFTYATLMENVGDTSMTEPVEMTVELPPELEMTSLTPGSGAWFCDGLVGTIHCTYIFNAFFPVSPGGTLIAGGGANIPLKVLEGTPDGPLGVTTSFTSPEAPPVPPHTEQFEVTSSHAPFEVATFSNRMTDPSGEPFATAGQHPDALETTLNFSTRTNSDGQTVPVEGPRNIEVELPPGFVGNPVGIPRCTEAQLQAATEAATAACPPASQVGVVEVYVGDALFRGGVFNMAPPEGVPAQFGFMLAGKVVHMNASLRTGRDYGLTVNVRNIDQTLGVFGTRLTMWGRPADATHDYLRGVCGDATILGWSGEGCPAAGDPIPRAFLTNQTSCTTPETRVRAVSWRGTESRAGYQSQTSGGDPLPVSGCDRVPFSGSLSVQPANRVAGQPTGLAVDLSIPQPEDPLGTVTAHLRNTVVTLPEGMAVSPPSANGLGACSPAEIGLSDSADPRCPDSSKIGTVRIDTPLLEEPMEGSVYLARQRENPFGSLLAIYLVAKGPGVIVKLPGKIETDPLTGRVTTSFTDNPQLPFTDLHLRFNGGPRAALVNPPTCGEKEVSFELTPWSGGAPVRGADTFTISGDGQGGSCPAEAPFAPRLAAGTADPSAGSYSPFSLRVTRGDGEQNLSSLTATLPEGLLAKLAGVPLCGDASAAAGSCPAASRVGSVTVGVGSGSMPLYVPQPGKSPTAAYLAGPYKGAPYSLVVAVPVQAGPFDLGTVTVRNALRVDAATAQVTAASDPMPQIIEGIPVAYRDLRVEVDRPQFTVNPTSCRPMQIAGVISSSTGRTASPSSRFQATGCRGLGFHPSLSLAFKGDMKRGGNPAIAATLKAAPGEANIAATTVVLPRSSFIDNAHVRNPCTRVQFAAGACPPQSILGTATAYTPLLDQPLQGTAYFRSNGGERSLPDIVVDLDGQIHITLVGYVDSVKAGKRAARVRTRFLSVPDAPVSKFVLRLSGGKRGLIENSQNLCRSAQQAKVQMSGQNGKAHNFTQRIATGCGRKAKR
jgi:hypothetical protein